LTRRKHLYKDITPQLDHIHDISTHNIFPPQPTTEEDMTPPLDSAHDVSTHSLFSPRRPASESESEQEVKPHGDHVDEINTRRILPTRSIPKRDLTPPRDAHDTAPLHILFTNHNQRLYFLNKDNLSVQDTGPDSLFP